MSSLTMLTKDELGRVASFLCFKDWIAFTSAFRQCRVYFVVDVSELFLRVESLTLSLLDISPFSRLACVPGKYLLEVYGFKKPHDGLVDARYQKQLCCFVTKLLSSPNHAQALLDMTEAFQALLSDDVMIFKSLIKRSPQILTRCRYVEPTDHAPQFFVIMRMSMEDHLKTGGRLVSWLGGLNWEEHQSWHGVSHHSNSVLMNATFREDLTNAFVSNCGTAVSLLDIVHISVQIAESVSSDDELIRLIAPRKLYPVRIAKYLSKSLEVPFKTLEDVSDIRTKLHDHQFYWMKQSKFLTRVCNGLV
jgi:hypothetical protein